MMTFIDDFFQKVIQTPGSLLLVYVTVYFLWGVLMHNFGIYTKIARFKYWWQIISCYILYMIPISILLDGLPWYQQYAYGLFFMGILEFGGYAIKSSTAYENNILDRFFGVRNFALGMTLFFATYFPIGNAVVHLFHGLIF